MIKIHKCILIFQTAKNSLTITVLEVLSSLKITISIYKIIIIIIIFSWDFKQPSAS